MSLRTRCEIFFKNINRSRLIFSFVGVTSSIILLLIIIIIIFKDKNVDNDRGENFCSKFNPYCDEELHTMCKFPVSAYIIILQSLKKYIFFFNILIFF